jgi:predicted nucleic acid-binding protein
MLQRPKITLTDDEHSELMVLSARLTRQAGYLVTEDMDRYLLLEAKRMQMLYGG